ncbi:hypothetical protein ACO2Q3_03160 [Caulobacter sp. KR2-114]|uniref:hypothetical protein n=1 Tax=Caulobacter sp. KR2-114 TaxID=3400912 RepID=UPI003C09A850
MLISKTLMAIAALATAGAAVAAPASSRMSDVQFLQLNRCAGLVASQQLGGGDGKLVDAVIREQSRGRDPYIMERADQMRDDAATAAQHASGDYRAKLVAERDGVCQNLAPNSATTSVAHAPAAGAASSVN